MYTVNDCILDYAKGVESGLYDTDLNAEERILTVNLLRGTVGWGLRTNDAHAALSADYPGIGRESIVRHMRDYVSVAIWVDEYIRANGTREFDRAYSRADEVIRNV